MSYYTNSNQLVEMTAWRELKWVGRSSTAFIYLCYGLWDGAWSHLGHKAVIHVSETINF